jgi:hypothetical protein
MTRDRGTPHPPQWDDRVEALAEFVEDERGIAFDHPVFVDFLAPKEFLEKSRPNDIDRSGQDSASIDRTVRLLQAMGVVGDDLDLYNSMDQLRGTSVLGYYSYTDDTIRIRGTEVTPAVQATLIHELTHALQAQQVDMNARMFELQGDPAKEAAFLALLEGDANRIQLAWRQSLDESARDDLDADLAEAQASGGGGSSRVPPVVKALVTAPYRLGQTLLTVVLQEGGQNALNDLYLTPPTTQEHLLDPWTLVRDHQNYLVVDEPGLDNGEQQFDHGTFGALSWLLVLAVRLTPQQALNAADGWGGDSYVAFTRDGVDCLRMDYAADTPLDRSQMRAALSTWIRRSRDVDASVSREGQHLRFEVCATGPFRPSDRPDQTREALDLATLRTTVSVDIVRTGIDPDSARCGADLLVAQFDSSKIHEVTKHVRRLRNLIRPCLPDGSD